MSDIDFSDIGDVLASRFEAIGINPESDEPLNLPATATADTEPTVDDDLVSRTLAAGEEPTEATPPTPAATPAPVAPAPQPAAGETPSAPPAVMAYLRDKYGADFSAKYQSDEAFLQGVINLNKKLGERDEYANLGRVLEQDPARVVQHLQQTHPHLFPKPEPQPAAPAQQPKTQSGFNPAWFKAMSLKADIPAEMRQEIETWAQNEALAQTPIGQQLQSQAAKIAQLEQLLSQGPPQQGVPDVNAHIAQFRQEQEAREFVNTNPWLFTEANGVRVLSPEGFVYKQALEEAQADGMSFVAAKKYADKTLAVHRSRTAPAVPAKTPINSPAAARQAAPAVPVTEANIDYAPRDGESLSDAIMRNLKRENLLDAFAGA